MKTMEKTMLGVVAGMVLLFAVTSPNPNNTVTPPKTPVSPSSPSTTPPSKGVDAPSTEDAYYHYYGSPAVGD